MRILIVGATSGIAKECAKIWAAKGEVKGGSQFILVGRNQKALDSAAADLKIRSPKAEVAVYAFDLTDAKAAAAFEQQFSSAGQVDICLIAQGELTDQTLAQTSVDAVAQSITVNATSVAVFAEIAARKLEAQGSGTLAIFGSVAGDRSRRANYTYGAAKAFIASYVAGLQHRFAGTGVKALVIKPGPTATPMTTALATSGRLASAESVAAEIVRGIEKGNRQIYAPGLWKIIMLVVRMIPRPIFDKLNF